MKVTLRRHTFPDRPDWIIVDENVPLGTEYEVIEYLREGAVLGNKDTGESREVEVYFLIGNGSTGYLPCICFEDIDVDKIN